MVPASQPARDIPAAARSVSHRFPLRFTRSMTHIQNRAIRKVQITFWWNGKKEVPAYIRSKGISDSRASSSRRRTYRLRSRVWKKPSTSRNAKIGKARRPTQVSQSCPATSVAQIWSQSIKAMAKMWRVRLLTPPAPRLPQ